MWNKNQTVKSSQCGFNKSERGKIRKFINFFFLFPAGLKATACFALIND
jgi:hypothetical protein